jgi:hypothetical protein
VLGGYVEPLRVGFVSATTKDSRGYRVTTLVLLSRTLTNAIFVLSGDQAGLQQVFPALVNASLYIGQVAYLCWCQDLSGYFLLFRSDGFMVARSLKAGE